MSEGYRSSSDVIVDPLSINQRVGPSSFALRVLLVAPPSKAKHDKTCATFTYHMSLPSYVEKRRKELGRSMMTKTFLLYTNEHPQGGCELTFSLQRYLIRSSFLLLSFLFSFPFRVAYSCFSFLRCLGCVYARWYVLNSCSFLHSMPFVFHFCHSPVLFFFPCSRCVKHAWDAVK
ncbi:hypothetical protein CPC08DRAFT_495807 [Agrocybe pediades]|nr:hypothetical protein CPC08DRAFT_495807 [Agrocybe pediades]